MNILSDIIFSLAITDAGQSIWNTDIDLQSAHTKARDAHTLVRSVLKCYVN